MSAIVDFEYYSTVYMGTEADEASFPALCARAGDVIGAMIRWKDPETMTAFQLTLYKKAVCAQVDYFAVNGLDSVAGGTDKGFTVGKVSVSGKSGSDVVKKGAMSGNISPMVLMYLEQSGLMAPQVATAPDMPLVGWWF
jgi:hypothetical protein